MISVSLGLSEVMRKVTPLSEDISNQILKDLHLLFHICEFQVVHTSDTWTTALGWQS